jgi:putative IMPACT (imprinted ancient) family translation regulator
MIAFPYSYFERIKLLIQSHNGIILDEEFTGEVTLTCQFDIAQFNPFQVALSEMTHGSLRAEIIETNQETIMPLGSFQSKNEVHE